MRKDSAKDKAAMDAAKAVAAVKNEGDEIVNQATIKATDDMAKMMRHFKTPSARLEAIKAHAFHMGIGTQFMALVVPHADEMKDDLTKLTGSEGEARVLTGMWLAKIFMEIEKGVANHDK